MRKQRELIARCEGKDRAVGLGPLEHLERPSSARARMILDDDRRGVTFHVLDYESADDVGRAAGRKPDQHTRTFGDGLR